MTEATAPLFVPSRSCIQIPARLFPESDAALHNFLRISAITSSAGRPGSPSASYASSLRSSSARCSAVSGKAFWSAAICPTNFDRSNPFVQRQLAKVGYQGVDQMFPMSSVKGHIT